MRLSFEGAVLGLHKAVEEIGAEHTANCVISQNGLPVCIVGQVFYDLDPAKFSEVKPHGNVRLPASMMEIELEERAARVLKAAQLAQDGDLTGGVLIPWGLAVEFAETHADLSPLDDVSSYDELETAFHEFLDKKGITLYDLDPSYYDWDHEED